MLTSKHLAAPLPENEADRLAELAHYQILDTQSEPAFDRLTRMAARRFDLPIALVSLVDRDRQWFKSHYGLDATETPRDLAFCAHTILQSDVMVVHDTVHDPRFAANPLVQSDPHIRFYAGAPLTTASGYRLGTLCVIDRKPHPEFSTQHKNELAELAAITVDEMELRLSIQQTRQDLDELRKAQQALESSSKKTELLTKEKLGFIATISHELRTPMNGVLGMTYLLRDTQLDKLQREYVDTINHSAENLLLLVNDVLDMSKIEEGQLILEMQPFDIAESFTQTTRLLKPLAGKKDNMLLCLIAPNVPKIIVGDQGRFAQILTNLVGNALKFTDNGKVQASLTYNADANIIRCEVSDTGIGIPPDKHDTIFEKFTQGDASITRKYGGTGLGLAITKHLVDMLGGTLGFESKQFVGTRFWFTLPVELPSRVNPAIAALPTPEKECGQIDAGKARVLIAEDHPVNRLFLIALLNKFGFGVIDVAENGLEVLGKLQSAAEQKDTRPYDAIFMDCKMPGMDGCDTTRVIRTGERDSGQSIHIPIVAMTANAMAGDREACFSAGMDEYLSKPLHPERLKDVLKKWFAFPAEPDMSLPAALATDSKLPPLDFARLNLVATTEEDQAALMTLFFRLAAEAIAIMELARRSEETSEWKDTAHSLRGSAANLGMAELENICRQAENAIHTTYAQRSFLLQRLESEIAEIKAYVKRHNPSFNDQEVP